MTNLKAARARILKVQANPTHTKVMNLDQLQWDLEDVEADAVERQESCKEGSARYRKLEATIDECNALYELISAVQDAWAESEEN